MDEFSHGSDDEELRKEYGSAVSTVVEPPSASTKTTKTSTAAASIDDDAEDDDAAHESDADADADANDDEDADVDDDENDDDDDGDDAKPGPTPLRVMKEGETIQVPGSGAAVYTVKRVSNHYYCTYERCCCYRTDGCVP